MNEEVPAPAYDPWPRLREEWAVHDALQDPKILATFELFARHHFAKATKDFMLDDLERQVVNRYGVPIERVPEVFGKAENQIWQEMEANGEE